MSCIRGPCRIGTRSHPAYRRAGSSTRDQVGMARRVAHVGSPLSDAAGQRSHRLCRHRTAWVAKVLLIADVNTIRETTTIFDDIFWVISHTPPRRRIACLRALLRAERHYAPSRRLRGDQQRTRVWRTDGVAEARRTAKTCVWAGNVSSSSTSSAPRATNLEGLSCAFAGSSPSARLSFECAVRRVLLLDPPGWRGRSTAASTASRRAGRVVATQARRLGHVAAHHDRAADRSAEVGDGGLLRRRAQPRDAGDERMG